MQDYCARAIFICLQIADEIAQNTLAVAHAIGYSLINSRREAAKRKGACST
jgi:hypothetical protein